MHRPRCWCWTPFSSLVISCSWGLYKADRAQFGTCPAVRNGLVPNGGWPQDHCQACKWLDIWHNAKWHAAFRVCRSERKNVFSSNFWGMDLWDLITHTSLGHPLFIHIFRISTIPAGCNLDSQFKSYFSRWVFQKLVILVSLVSNLNHMRKSKQHSGSQTRQTKLISCLVHWLGFFFFLVFDFDLQNHFTKSFYRQGVLQTCSTLRALLTHMAAGC